MEELKDSLKVLGVQIIADLSQDILLCKSAIAVLREQDINARVMKDDKFARLVSNIKKRGGLESLPFCVLIDNRIEIVSGHHRVKASREAGLSEIPFLLDVSGLNRSQIAAKQLAHNAISGIDDPDTLREITKLIHDVDDMLESAIDSDLFTKMDHEIDALRIPAFDFEWKTIQFAFLDHQLADFKTMLENITGTDYGGVIPIELFEPFVEALTATQKFGEIKSVGTAIYAMVTATLKHLEVSGYSDDPDIEWISIAKIIGGNAIPRESAEVIDAAIKKMQKNGEVTDKNKWEALEYLAADYLAK